MSDLIAFVGPLQSGKTTAAKYLAGNYGYTRFRFAGPIKAMLREGFGLSEEQVDGSLKDVPTPLLGGQTPRHAMETLGIQWGREMIHPSLWLMAWENTRPSGPLVIDDCRFPNEHETLKGLEGIVVRITRPGHEHSDRHEAEAHRLPHDIEIHNDGTLEDFLTKVEELLGLSP